MPLMFLKVYLWEIVKQSSTLYEPSIIFRKDEASALLNAASYRSINGALQYLTSM